MRITQKGFSLIELMVVVAIIGILAAVAVPQFSKFQARARQSAAKSLLSAMFTGEKSFQAEWNAYTANASYIGVGIDGTNARYDGMPGSAANATWPAGAPGGGADSQFSASQATAGGVTWAFPAAPTDPAIGTQPTATTFTASVYGDPNNTITAPYNVDQWTINENKLITNVNNGIN